MRRAGQPLTGPGRRQHFLEHRGVVPWADRDAESERSLRGQPAQHLRFAQLMQQLPQERLVIAIQAIAAIEAAMEHTVAYVKERKAFGKQIIDFQNTRFKLAELKTKAQVARVFVDDCIARHLKGELDVATAAMAKYFTTDLQCELIDECLQFFGGYGYMWEYPIARLYADARVQKIYGGTNEIMKELIGRTL